MMLLRVLIMSAMLACSAEAVYAADGDLIVNGKIGAGTITPREKVDVNGNVIVSGSVNAGSAIVNGNLAVSGTVTAPNVLAKYYESPEQTITLAGALTLAHGLGVEPKLIQTWLVCKTAEGNYSIGDKVLVPATYEVWAGAYYQLGCSIVPDSTSLNIRFASGQIGSAWLIPNKTTGTPFFLTNANWKVIFRAWAF